MFKLIRKGFNKSDIVSYGNSFLLGNSFYGYRGTLEEYRKSEMVGLNVEGFYDQFSDKWRESINLPNPFYIKAFVDDKSFSILDNNPKDNTIILDIKEAVFYRETIYDDLVISSRRFVSSTNKSLLCLEYKLKSLKKQNIKINVGYDTDIYEINGPHFKEKTIENSGHFISFKGVTNENKSISTLTYYEIDDDNELFVDDSIFFFKIDKELSKNEEIIIRVYSLIEKNASSLDNLREEMDKVIKSGFDSELKNHIKAFSSKWLISDIKLEGDGDAQFNLRYSIYHLLILGDKDNLNSIPARGISGETYKGAIFWDTEMFMLPFFINTNPLVARSLIEYRINTLGGAISKALEYGYIGAFYAWESQDDGIERCSKYNVTDAKTNEPIRTYFNEKQIHISADIIYAIDNYIKRTNDFSVLIDGAYKVIFECIKFFYSYKIKENDGMFHFNDVIGPDEYHERVDDNAFTNYMIKNAVKILLKYYDGYQEVLNDQSLTKQDIEYFMNHIYLPKINDNLVIEQFKGYFDLEDTSVLDVKSRVKCANEYLGGEFGVATKTRVIKQADTVAMLTFLSDDFSLEVIKANYDYYYPYTEHGSSLSSSIYAVSGAKLSYLDIAYKMFTKSSSIDLGTDQKMFAGGIYIGGTHPASNAGSYLSLIYGFAGLKYQNNILSFEPHLPKSIKSLSFKIFDKGVLKSVKIESDNKYMIGEADYD